VLKDLRRTTAVSFNSSRNALGEIDLKTKVLRFSAMLVFVAAVVSPNLFGMRSDPHEAGAYQWSLPKGFPSPRVPADNLMSAAKVELGRHLFYDVRLSVNQTTSCATCHRQELAFTDGQSRAIGATGEVHPRASMSLANVAYAPTLAWANPSLTSLERQPLVPIFGEHPVEMGMAGREEELLANIRAERLYRTLFNAAYPNQNDPYTLGNVTKALASFVRILISGDSPYDRYKYRSEVNAISPAAKRGEQLFFGERLECFDCHNGFNLSGPTDSASMALGENTFENNGLYNLDGKGSYPTNNTGVFEITSDPADMGKFKIPTLRNIAVTAPYMHDGSIKSLSGVIDHYAAGGRVLKGGALAGDGRLSPLKSNLVRGFKITKQERKDLIAFLKSLTDEKFLRNSRFANPWKH
jgi:cytochrome c peroxidase